MELRIKTSGNVFDVTIEGALDLYTVHDANLLIKPLLSTHGIRLAFDLANIDYIDSSGIAALAHWQKRVIESGGGMILANIPENLRKVMELTGLLDEFTCQADDPPSA